MKKYDSYKDSGVEWIGEIPEHWAITKLKNFTSIFGRIGFRGYTVEDIVEKGTGAISLSPSNITEQKINLEKGTYISWDKYYESPEIQIKNGDIILVKTASVGKVAFVEKLLEEATLNPQLVVFKQVKLNNKYLYYLLISELIQTQIKSDLVGGVVPTLSQSVIKNYYIPLNSIEEQTSIANYLDQKTTQIDDLIAKKERLIQLLEEERTAMINQAVTKGLDQSVPKKDSGIEWLGEIPEHWEVKKLKQIFNSSKGLTITKENLEDEGIPCVNYGEIHSKFGFEVDIDKHHLKCVNPTYLESDYKSLIQTGDFVFADTSEDVSGAGNFTYLKSNHEIFAGYHTIILRALCDIESRYFAYQFDSIPYRTQIRQSVKGIKVFSITQGILKNTNLWIPPLDEQKQIIEFLDIETDRIVSIKNSTRKEIELLKEFKTALISEVVTGKVDVRDELIK